jgi:ABC-type Fe3+ transport system permease subunit
MKTDRAPAHLLAFLYVCFVCCLIYSAPLLPERVATHFNGQGRPDGWMSRTSHMVFTTVFGFAFPLLPVGLFYVIRFAPEGLNVPHRDYWLAPERRRETFDYLFRHSLWFACIVLGLIIGVQFLVVQANAEPRAQLSTPMILSLLGFFLAGVVAWVASLISHFRIPVSV